jgi:sugar phosphate isomerase/epimerase
MSGWRANLLSEIEFAKKHFDFVEITIQPELLKKIDDIFYDLKSAVNGFEVLGHIHEEITDFDDMVKNIEVLKNLGAKKITIHPFQNLSIEENAKNFNKINIFLQNNAMQMLIENISNAPFNSADNMLKLLEKIPDANTTLDAGHANKIFELDKFINIFKTKIKHIHLHDNKGNFDHLFYEDQGKLDGIISKIRAFGYNDTVLFETFSILKDDKSSSQEFPEIKKLHIEQLKKVRI